MVKHLKGRNGLVHNLEGDANVDSDCEDHSTGVSGGTLKEERGEEEDCAVLNITGSFSA